MASVSQRKQNKIEKNFSTHMIKLKGKQYDLHLLQTNTDEFFWLGKRNTFFIMFKIKSHST